MGTYTSCLTSQAGLAYCEAEDLAIRNTGFVQLVDFFALNATRAQLQARLAYDASIGLTLYLNVKEALADANMQTGNNLITVRAGPLATDCGVTTDAALISCVATTIKGIPNTAWYIYDEPGCPLPIGFCAGSLTNAQTANVALLAQMIESQDSHAVVGFNTPSGVPSGGGANGCNGTAGWAGTCAQPQITDLYGWLVNSTTPITGYDYYPIPSSNGSSIDDIGVIAGLLQNVITANYNAEKIGFVVQAFSWYQEGSANCANPTVCPFPTQAQLQDMRDQALWYAWKAGNPLYAEFFYSWPDIACLTPYTGCNAAANEAAVSAVLAAPFPTSAPQ